METQETDYSRALAFQLAGAHADARQAYHAWLETHPQHGEALHNLGMLEFSQGNTDAALELLMNAIEAHPGEQQFWLALGEVLRTLQAWQHLASLLAQASAAGVPAEGLTALAAMLPQEAAVAAEPGHDWDAMLARVLELSQPGQKRKFKPSRPLDEKRAKKLIALFDAHDYHGMHALASKITQELPNHPAGWHFLGMAQERLGELLAGLQSLIKANELFPGDAQLLGHLGNMLAKFGHYVEAEACFHLSLANLHTSRRGKSLQQENLRGLVTIKVIQKNFAAARHYAEQVLQIAPRVAASHYSLAQVDLACGRMEAAITHLEDSLGLDPDFGPSIQDLGLAYFNLGRLPQALALTEQAVERKPEQWSAFSNLLFFLNHEASKTPEEIFARHAEFDTRYGQALRAQWRAHDNNRDPERKLRIGFVSGDFNDHAVVRFIEPVLQRLNREQFELYAFYNNTRIDDTTRRLQPMFNVWGAISTVSDGDLAELIRAARIDILVDLSGHTAGSRLLTFARKPAPVQISAVGYPDTTGLRAMDYRLTDRFLAPEGRFDACFVERILRMEGFVVFDFPQDAPEVSRLPALDRGYLTFGSFNRTGKITPVTLDAWSRLLQAVPTARMMIGSCGESARVHLLEEFAARGLAAERFDFMPRVSVKDYLAAHAGIDLLLDTFPYNAGTTALYSLWMGVPILTMDGERYLSNVGSALMHKIGMPEFVARDADDFVRLGTAWSQRLPELAALRAGLQAHLQQVPYLRPEFVTACYEKAFRDVWRKWCAEGDQAA